jgi:hypothetical protein
MEDDTTPAKPSDPMRREMTAISLGTMIEIYGVDMRLKNRTTDTINSNIGHQIALPPTRAGWM